MNSITYNKKIKVFYEQELDGGGLTFGQNFIPFLKGMTGKVDTLCEFCAGPGFIGFSLLANGQCDNLVLVDINPKAVEVCKKTIAENHLENNVRVYLSDGLKSVPKSEKWDIVISNPPNFDVQPRQNATPEQQQDDLKALDPGWKIHKEFYRDVGQFLKPDGFIVIQEQNEGSSAETFREMIESNGLVIKKDQLAKKVTMPTILDNAKDIVADVGLRFKQGTIPLSPSRIITYLKRTPHNLATPYTFYFIVVGRK